MLNDNRITKNGANFSLRICFLDPSHGCLLWEVERNNPDHIIILQSPHRDLPEMSALYVRDGFTVKDGKVIGA